MPGDESVMIAFAKTSSPSRHIERVHRQTADRFPLRTPRETMRDAVRWAAPCIPSKRMSFLARGAALGACRFRHASTVSRTSAAGPSRRGSMRSVQALRH